MGTVISSASISSLKPIFKVTDFTASTGVTTNDLTGSIIVPANTVTVPPAGNVVEITARAVKTGTNGTVTIRVYANTTNSLSGATLLASSPAAAAANLYVQLSRTAFIGKSPVGTKILQAGGQAYSDDTAFTGAEATAAVDWTVDQYIILAVQNGSTLDSTIGSGILFKLYK
jgi:hypothetical protein